VGKVAFSRQASQSRSSIARERNRLPTPSRSGWWEQRSVYRFRPRRDHGDRGLATPGDACRERGPGWQALTGPLEWQSPLEAPVLVYLPTLHFDYRSREVVPDTTAGGPCHTAPHDEVGGTFQLDSRILEKCQAAKVRPLSSFSGVRDASEVA